MNVIALISGVVGIVAGFFAKRMTAPTTPNPTKPSPVVVPPPVITPPVVEPEDHSVLNDFLNLVVKNKDLLALVKMVIAQWKDQRLAEEQAAATKQLAKLKEWDETPG